MNKTLLIPFLIILLGAVGTGVYFVTADAFNPKQEKVETTVETTMEPVDNIEETTQTTTKDETPPSKNYDEMMMELDKTIEVEATTTNEESEVDSATTVTSDSYLDIYNANEF